MTAFASLRLQDEAPAREAGLDLPGLLAVFRRRIGLFVSVAILAFALVTLVTFQLTPLYDAQARLIVDARETRALDVTAMLSGVPADAAMVDTEVGVVASRRAARAVAETLSLWSDPEFGAEEAGSPPGLLARLAPPQLRPPEPDPEQRRARTVDRLLAAVEAERAGATYAIAVTATSRVPEKAAAIANAFAEQYLTGQLDQKFEAYRRVNDYLAEAEQRARAELRAAEEAVEAYRAGTGLLSAQGALLSERQLSDLQAQLVVQEADLEERRAQLAAAERRRSAREGTVGASLTSPVIVQLRAKQADLTRRRAEVATRYGPLHPQMDEVRSELADVEAQVAEETARIVSGLENEVRVQENRVGALQGRIEAVRDELGTDNAQLVRLRELEGEAEVARLNWQALRTRGRETTQLAELAGPDARIADPATVPVAPAYPNKPLNLVLGLMLGGGLGVLAVALAEVFDDGMRTEADVERQLGTGLLALVPELDGSKLDGHRSPADYLVDKPLSVFAESYRTVRSAVRPPEPGRGRVVAVASAVSGEGKTVSALCLARIAALSGDRAVLIDGDLRRRVLSQGVEAAEAGEGRGLAEVLAGLVPLRAALRRDPLTDLDLLPVSEDRSGTGDLFGSARFAALLERLRAEYDLVILDTPPLTAVADARLAVRAADLAVLFVRWKRTPVALGKAAAKVLAGTGTPVAGAVLTRVDPRAQAGYGYEGSDRYYARHGRYYFD